MVTDMKQTFLQRYEEGYDLQNDTLYIAWQTLKKNVHPALQDITNSQPQPSKMHVLLQELTQRLVIFYIFQQLAESQNKLGTEEQQICRSTCQVRK